jgi:hypothetical protein
MVCNFNSFKAFVHVCGEEIGSVAYVGGEILNMLMLVRKIF